MIKQNWCVSSEEKTRILNLHESATKRLYLSEDDTIKQSAIQSKTNPNEMTLKGESFFSNGKWKNLSPQGKEQLDSQLASAARFLAGKKGRGVVYVKIIAGESQVTNTDNENPEQPKVEPGYLSEKRATTMKNYLTQYFDNLLSQGIISSKPIFEAPEIIIGSTPYKKGDPVDNENYKKERFVNVELKLQSPEKCIIGLTIEVMYNKDKNPAFPCRGGHTCDEAKFNVKLNGVVIGVANLNNSVDGGSRTSKPLIVTDAQARKILGGQSKDIIISLQCISGTNCHSSTPEVKISKGPSVIYWGCSPFIESRGETEDKTILVLDNCGNLKQKGTNTENEGENKPIAAMPKLTGKVKEYPVGVNGDPSVTISNLIKAGIIDSKEQQDGSYISLKNMGASRGIVPGDKVVFVKKDTPENVPATAQIVSVKTTKTDTPETAANKLIDSKSAVITDKPGVLKIVKYTIYNTATYKPNQFIRFT
jgi:hypothetical protein